MTTATAVKEEGKKGKEEQEEGKKKRPLVISPPNFKRAIFRIIGIAPYVQLAFSGKAQNKMREKHEQGSQAKKGIKREKRDFNEDYKNAFHVSTEGWHGIPAAAFRNAMISACRVVGFQMTKAKLSVFVEEDGISKGDGTPMVKIEGTPEKVVHHVRNATGVADLRARAMWREWAANVTFRWDDDQFSMQDMLNLLARVGLQVGIGEGRPDSKTSAGMGWGMFKLESDDS